MSDRFYHHSCPKDVWEKSIMFLPTNLKEIALDCIGSPDTYLMKNYTVKKEWIYFTTRKLSEKMERVIHIYLQNIAWESYGAY